jgi:antitoxin CptB
MDDARLRKLRFRAWRRGFREADLIIGQFADAELQLFSEEELAQFEALLEQPDQDLYAWIIGQAAAPEAFDTPVLERLRRFSRSAPMGRPGA